MKNDLKILFIIFCSSLNLLAQSGEFNSSVTSSGQLSCTVIKPLSVYPLTTDDYINWPTIPVGSKLIIAEHNPDADWRSIFTYSGEPGMQIAISVARQMEVDNVEISYQLKGTPIQYLGVNNVPLLQFNESGLAIVNLNSSGAFYVHIVYEWVWAKDNATTGDKLFVQVISAQYYGI